MPRQKRAYYWVWFLWITAVLHLDLGAQSLTLAVRRQVSEGDGVVSNALFVVVQGTLASNTIVELAASPSTEVQIPDSVLVFSNSAELAVSVRPIDNDLLDGTRTVRISAKANGVALPDALLTILDNDAASLYLQFPAELMEGQIASGQIVSSRAPHRDFLVTLTNSLPGSLGGTRLITLPAGKTNAAFSVAARENQTVDPPTPATLTAFTGNWSPAVASFVLTDNEPSNISVVLPASISESAGTRTNAGRITLAAPASVSIVFKLSAEPAGRLSVPAQAVLPAGQSTVLFNITTIDDELRQGTTAVSILASAPWLQTGQASISVLDDDPASLDLAIVPSPQFVGLAFTNRVRALDINGQQLAAGSFPVDWRIESADGTNAFGPATITNGQATLMITPATRATAARIVAEAKDRTGVSAPFNILGAESVNVPVQIRDIVWLSTAGRLLATVPDGAPSHGGEIVEVDPATGELATWVVLPGGISSTGVFAGRLAASPDESRLFVSSSNGTQLTMWNLPAKSLVTNFCLPNGQFTLDFAAGVASPWRLLLVTSGGNGLLFNESLASLAVPGTSLFRSVVVDPLTPDTFYCFKLYETLEWQTGPAGFVRSRSLRSGPYQEGNLPMAAAANRLFCGDGCVLDLASGTAVGNLAVASNLVISPKSGLMDVHRARGQILVASPAGPKLTRLQSFDLEDLQIRRESYLDRPLAAPRRMLLCGANSLAVLASNTLSLVRWPIVPASSSPVDLAVLPTALTVAPTIGSNWDWSVTITNRGPAAATDVRMRVVLPPNVAVLRTQQDVGRIWLETNILQSWAAELPAGSNMVVSFTLRPLTGGYLTNLFAVFANEDELIQRDNAATLVSYVAPSGTPEVVESLRLPVRELVYDAVRGRVYALERTAAQATETKLFQLDLRTLEPTLLRTLPGTATHLRLSPTGGFLYATDNGGKGILRVDLAGVEPDLQFVTWDAPSTNAFKLMNLEIDPGDPRTILAVSEEVTNSYTFVLRAGLFTDGIQKPAALTVAQNRDDFGYGSAMQFNPVTRTATLAIAGYWNPEVYELSPQPGGLALKRHYDNAVLGTGFIFAGEKIYTRKETLELDPANLCQLRSVPYSSSFYRGYPLLAHEPNHDRLALLDGQFEVFDRATFAKLGQLAFSSGGAIDSFTLLDPGRAAFADTGQVFVAATTLLAPPTNSDLAIGLTAMPIEPRLNEPVTFTVAVSNRGPATARAAGVTLQIPSGFSRVSVVPAPTAAAHNGYFPEPLLWTGVRLQPGATAVFQVVGRFTSAGRMHLRAGVADRNSDPNRADNRMELIVPVTYFLANGQSAALAHKVVDALFDSTRNTILATVTGDDPLSGQLVSINPWTGLIETNWSVGFEPSALALGDDRQTLYVAVDGGLSVARLNLQTMQTLSTFALASNTPFLAPITARKMRVNPDSPGQLAVQRSDGVLALYEAGVALPSTASSPRDFDFLAPNRLVVASMRYQEPLGVYYLNDQGLQEAGFGSFWSPDYYGRTVVRGWQGMAFTQDGRAVDPSTFAQVGRYAGFGPALLCPEPGLVLYLSDVSSMSAFDLQSQALVGRESFTNSLYDSADLFSAGDNLVVVRSYSGDLSVLRLNSIPLAAPADLAVTIENSSPWRAGLPLECSGTIRNSGPNPARGVRLDLRLPAGMSLVSASLPITSATEPQCTLWAGELAPAETLAWQIRALPQSASWSAELVVSTRSAAADPDLRNNSARVVQPIQTSQVANRVDWLPLSAEEMLYEPHAGLLLLSAPQPQPGLTNMLLAITPTNGAILRQIELPGRPGKLAADPGGEFLYVALDGSSRILRLTLPALETNLIFPALADGSVLPRPNCDMVVLSNQPGTVAISRYGGGTPAAGGVWIYDNGQPRERYIPGGYGQTMYLAASLTEDTLIGSSESAKFQWISMLPDGLQAGSFVGLQNPNYPLQAGGEYLLDGTTLYSRSLLLPRGTINAAFPPQAQALSSTGDRVVLAWGDVYRYPQYCEFAGFRADTLALVGTNRFSSPGVQLTRLVLWGEDGVAALGNYYGGLGTLFLGRLDLAGSPSSDSDGDGMPDKWESDHGLNPLAADANEDADFDGASNYLEYLSGTDAQSASSVPAMTMTSISTNQLRLSFPCAGGRQYSLERTTSLYPPAWTTVTNATSLGGMQLLQVTGTVTTQSFFRVRISP